jgi:hypothetical protein
MRTEREHLDDEAIVELLDAQAARQGAMLAVHRVDGYWRAGFVALDDLGEIVVGEPAHGPDRSAALHQLLARGGRRKQ